jgi:sugar/nucleoside kinase (ribokinase family)
MTSDNLPDERTSDAAATCYDRLPSKPSGGDVMFGFDGYVDTVRTVGTDAGAGERIATLDELGEEIMTSAAADSSLSISWERQGQRTGGHASHLARAYLRLGFDPTIVGMCGDPVLDIFRREFADCTIRSLGEPGRTDAIEFDDKKLLLTENGDEQTLDWATLRSQVGIETLADELDGARLLGVGYWSMIPGLAGILDGIRETVLPRLSAPPQHVLIDPANVRKLDPEEIDEVAAATQRLGEAAELTLSGNRFETKVLAAELAGKTTDSIEADVRAVFDAIGVDRYVAHSPTRSVCVSGTGQASVGVEPVDEPVLTTSAGDHFNAGFALGIIEGLPDDAAVVLGNALARTFVRTGETPTYPELVSAVKSYDEQFG